MLNDGSVVAPAGLGQVHGLVAGEPFGQEFRAHTQGTRARNTLDNIQSIRKKVRKDTGIYIMQNTMVRGGMVGWGKK